MTGRKPFEEALDHIFWCDSCNVPLIVDVCGTCGATGRQVRLSPPGDVRFCSPYERSILRSLFDKSYGCDPIGERLTLLNKIPGDDKADEVIVDGLTIAVVYYDLKDADYKLDLRLYGAKLLLTMSKMKTVTVDVPRTMHLSGKGIKGSQVLDASPDIKKDDIILIKVNETFNGLGVARADAADIKDPAVNTVKIRKIGGGTIALHEKLSTIEYAVAANRPAMISMEKDAINLIKGVVSQGKNKELPVTVSFSGGKDSLVVLELTKKAVKDFEAFFIDTGLEFPETRKFVEETASKNNIPIKVQKAQKAFDENFPAFGPPAKDFRWCCKVCKLGPVTEQLTQYKSGVITIDGKRRYESFQRGGISTTEKNPFVPGQMSVFPIKDWRAIEVWLYIHMEKLPYNPLYDKGFERIGCWLCPAALQAEYVRMRELHPDRYGEWQEKLHQWAAGSGLSRDYVDLGFWRWKAHPNKMLNIAQEKGISLRASMKSGMALDIIRGVSPCTAGGYSIEGVLRLPARATPEKTLEMLKTIGSPTYSDDLDVTLIRSPKGTAKLFAGGQVYASANDKSEAGKLFEETVKQVLRASLCAKCKICIKSCQRKAIRLDGYIKVDANRCDRCGKCTRGCVIGRYYDRLIK
jgi:phosphoadenosine phosphosulfate reductase